MKVLRNKFGLIVRLGITVSAMLFSQHALAVGVAAGTSVTNEVTVSYDVNSAAQAPIVEPAPAFVVDRRVDFAVTVDGASDTVLPGDTGLTFDFTVQNDGNSDMDFEVTLRQMDSSDLAVNGNLDTDVVVSSVTFTDYVDNLAADTSSIITVTGDAAALLANLDVANIEVTFTAVDPSGSAGASVPLVDTSGAINSPGTIDNVLADTDNDGIELGTDGFIVSSAELVITKIASTIYDPINGLSVNAKAIPGAVIEYTVTIDNSAGAEAATGISIADVIIAPAVLVTTANNPYDAGNLPYNGGTANVAFGSGTFCLADTTDGNTDGCTLAGTDTLTIAGDDMSLGPIQAIDVAAAGTLTVTFQVLIPII
jgi:hypothetical protein